LYFVGSLKCVCMFCMSTLFKNTFMLGACGSHLQS
jgi:hypothetical protein